MKNMQARILRTKIVGAKLRQIREQKNKTLKETGAYLGISSTVLSGYESGRKAISLPELELFAFHFGVPVQDLYSDKNLPPDNTPQINPQRLVTLRQKMIGVRLRTQRNDANLSLREVARAVDIPPSRLSAYELGNRAIPLPELEAILNTLGQSPDEYLDVHGPIGQWIGRNKQQASFQTLSDDMRAFISKPENAPYLQLAQHLSELPNAEIESLAQHLLSLLPAQENE